MSGMVEPASVPGICEVQVVEPQGAPPAEGRDLLIEVPHGATAREHFESTRRALEGSYPEDLEEFFFVNTDVGSFEAAREIARLVVDPGATELEPLLDPALRPPPFRSVTILRCLVPRTFVDCNRVLTDGAESEVRSGITPGMPAYVNSAEDVAALKAMHRRYSEVADSAYRDCCGRGGAALIVHTYAPRSVRIDRIDGGIVAALRRAYQPGVYESWEPRPEVDVISESEDGSRLAPDGFVATLARSYAAVGVGVAENATYRLHPTTMGYVYSARYPRQVVCLEINRALLADPFVPFREMLIGERKVQRMAAPIAAALLVSLSRP